MEIQKINKHKHSFPINLTKKFARAIGVTTGDHVSLTLMSDKSIVIRKADLSKLEEPSPIS